MLLFLLACSSSTPTAPALTPVTPSGAMSISSPMFADGDALPESLKCERDGGTGQSPPLVWHGAPSGTESLAVVMHHFPNGTDPATDAPSHYWLLWNLPPKTTSLPQGNPQSLGTEGSDKDGHTTGYTPPCSPGGSGTHTYTLTVYALSHAPASLGTHDSRSVDWSQLMTAVDGTVLDVASMQFVN